MAQTGDQVSTAAFFCERRGIVAAVGSVVAASLLATSSCATQTPSPSVSLAPTRAVADEPPALAPARATKLSAIDIERIIDDSIDRIAVPSGGPSRGPADAKVIMVVFNSFQGPWGRRVDLELDQLAREYPTEVRTFFRHYPNRGITTPELEDPKVRAQLARGTYFRPKYDLFQIAAQAAVAADAQGKFWEMRDQLFNHQSAFERSLLDEYATAAGLDVRRFGGDFGQPSGKAIVDADEDLGNRLGVGTAPMLFINGRPVPPFEPYEKIRSIVEDEIRRADDLLTGGTEPATLYAAFLAHAHRSLASVPKFGHPPSTEIYAVGMDRAPVRGAAQPKVTVIAFLDFECPYSARASQTLSEVAKEHPDEVAISFRHQPLEFHRHAMAAALAAQAAREQGKFWEMHDLLFARQEALDVASIEGYAKEVGLDLDAFHRSLSDSAGKRHVDSDVQLAERFGVRGAPYFFVNGRSFRGSQPASAWRELIEEEIKKADDRLAAGTPRAGLYADITRNGLTTTLAPLIDPRRPGRASGGAKTRHR